MYSASDFGFSIDGQLPSGTYPAAFDREYNLYVARASDHWRIELPSGKEVATALPTKEAAIGLLTQHGYIFAGDISGNGNLEWWRKNRA